MIIYSWTQLLNNLLIHIKTKEKEKNKKERSNQRNGGMCELNTDVKSRDGDREE